MKILGTPFLFVKEKMKYCAKKRERSSGNDGRFHKKHCMHSICC